MNDELAPVWLVLFFFAGALVMYFSASVSGMPFLTMIFTPAVTLCAAFGGAWYAFKLESDKQLREADKMNVAAADRAMFKLIRAVTAFVHFNKQFILSVPADSDRDITIKPATSVVGFDISIDYDSLTFLYETSDPDFLQSLSYFEMDVLSTLETINQRSVLHYEQVQPVIETLAKFYPNGIPPDAIKFKLGLRGSTAIHDFTNAMVQGIDRHISEGKRHIKTLEKLIEEKYPLHKKLKATFIEP